MHAYGRQLSDAVRKAVGLALMYATDATLSAGLVVTHRNRAERIQCASTGYEIIGCLNIAE